MSLAGGVTGLMGAPLEGLLGTSLLKGRARVWGTYKCEEDPNNNAMILAGPHKDNPTQMAIVAILKKRLDADEGGHTLVRAYEQRQVWGERKKAAMGLAAADDGLTLMKGMWLPGRILKKGTEVRGKTITFRKKNQRAYLCSEFNLTSLLISDEGLDHIAGNCTVQVSGGGGRDI